MTINVEILTGSLLLLLVILGVDVVEAQIFVLIEGSGAELDGHSGVGFWVEGVGDEGVGKWVDEDHCEGPLSLAHIGEVLKQDCDSCAERRIAVDEGIAFLEMVTDFLQQPFNCRENSSECTKAKF